MTKKLFITLSIIALSFTFCLFFIPLSQATDDPPCTNGDCPPTDPPCTNGDCPPDPGCTNEDCPPDPGCTNEDCPPDYWNNCCCYEEYNDATNRDERICCCRDDQSITCRKSYVITYNPPDHGLLHQIAIDTNACTDNAQQLCAPDWFFIFIGNYWDHLEESCSWWGDLQQWCMDVEIDIKPGSGPNSINCKNTKGVIAVAILTTNNFDATTVDHTMVTFEGASETHVDKKTGEPRRHEEDVDGDGDTDLVFHFRKGDTALTCDSTEGTLIGELFDGLSIEGTDTVRMIE